MHNGASVSSMMMRQNPNEFNIVMANLGAGRVDPSGPVGSCWKGLIFNGASTTERHGDEIPEILEILKLL